MSGARPTGTATWTSPCIQCLDFFDPQALLSLMNSLDDSRKGTITRTRSIREIEKSAGACELCKAIQSSVQVFHGEELPEITAEFAFGAESYDVQRIALRYHELTSKIDLLDYGVASTLREYTVYTTADDPAAHLVRNRPVELVVGSPESIETAKRWQKECTEEHRSCTERGHISMPTRCLKIDDINHIHLCDTQGQDLPYAALSYCWGPNKYKNLMTTKDTSLSRSDHIPLFKFPLTLRDGVLVAHQLGLRYIWIDSLCIIQDDASDKELEIAQMRRIFSNAHCTIIAATAAHCHAGFLHEREFAPFPEICVPYPGANEQMGSVILREHNPDIWTLYDPLEDPINERAWTLEERLLSPRRLIYSKNHLRWLCETSEYTMGGDIADRKWSGNRRWGQTERLAREFSASAISPADCVDRDLQQSEIWLAWLIIVEEYNMRCLTHPKDKLRAIGGIADLYRLKTKDHYCAGLWRSHLAKELLWTVFHPRATLSTMLQGARDPMSTRYPTRTLFPRPKYRAPTWSWASVDGTTANQRALTRVPFVMDVFEIIDCVVEPERPNTILTAVKSAVLTVKGRTKRALLHIETELLYEHVEAYNSAEYFGKSRLDALEDDCTADLRPVLCLEITSRVREGYIGNQQGIIIVQAPQGATFNRIGHFGTDRIDYNWFEGIEPQVLKLT